MVHRFTSRFCFSACLLEFLIQAGFVGVLHAVTAPAPLMRGDVARLTRGEMLMFKGKELTGAAKGQEFTVLKTEAAVVYVAFYKEDGSLIAGTLPTAALEPLPQNGWSDILRGAEAFQEQRYDEARRFLTRTAEDAAYRALAGAILTRVSGAITAATAARSADPARAATVRQACVNTLQGLRDTAEQLVQQGYISLAFALEEGTDRLGAQALGNVSAVPPSKTNREDLVSRAAIATRAVAQYRQASGLHRLVQASGAVREGLKADPGRGELKSAQVRLQKDITEAETHHENADKMRQHGPKGVIHALTALEMGLKVCADHPKLLALKKEMQSSFEERTAPQVTPAFLKAAGPEVSAKAMEEGRKLYTNRCTECHDLELLDSRTVSAWRDIVGTMARRAKIDGSEQGRIVAYLAAAQRGLDADQ
jgi:hypothetical protein